MLPGYGSLGHYYSSVRISRVEPMKRGDGTLRLEFYNAAYAAGVRDFDLELRVLLRLVGEGAVRLRGFQMLSRALTT